MSETPEESAPEESSPKKKQGWKAWLAGILTTIGLPLAGYLVHAYNQYVEAKKVQSQITMEQRKYDLQVAEARTANLKEYVPKLLSEDEKERAVSMAMISVLHPDEAPDILSAVASSLPEEKAVEVFSAKAEEEKAEEEGAEAEAEEGATASLYGYGMGSEYARRARASRRSSEAFGESPARVPKEEPVQQQAQQAYQPQAIRKDLEQRSKAAKKVADQEWTIVLGSAPTREDLEDVASEVANPTWVQKDGMVFLITGRYPSRHIADRTLISYNRTFADSAYSVNLASWCPDRQRTKLYLECGSPPQETR